MGSNKVVIGQRLHEVMELWHEGNKHELFGYILKGKALSIIKQKKLWYVDCSGVPSFRAYIKNELKISMAEAYRLIQIYETVGEIISSNNIPIKIGTLTLLLPHLRKMSDEEKKNLLIEYHDLPLEAVKNNLLDMTGNGHLATDVCNHEEMEMYQKCKKCHKFFKVD